MRVSRPTSLKEFLFDWPAVHPEPDLPTISATLMALFEHVAKVDVTKEDEAAYSDDRDLALGVSSSEAEVTNNYPDLVPRTCSRKLSSVLHDHSNVISNDKARDSSSVMSENFFLLAILLGTCILLYFFPPGP